MTQNNAYWPHQDQTSDNFEDSDIGMPSDFRKMGHFGQQFQSDYPAHNPHLDRLESRSYPGFPDQYLSDPVLDGSSGRILAPQGRESGMEAEPMRRFYEQTAPWHPQTLNSYSTTPRFQAPQNKIVTRPPAAVYNGYREPAKSNPESHLTGRYPPDSGYATNHPGSRSVASVGHDYMAQEDENNSLNQEVRGMQLRPGSPATSYYPEDPQAETATNVGSWNGDGNATGSNIACPHEPCNVDPKPRNQSEFKKHMQRHNKPFVCDFHDCPRANKGFTTKNDLDRHKKSVHKIIPPNSNDRSWICQGVNCNKKGKVWPRLDNFKSHCNRMHKKDDLEELVKKSEVGPDAAGSAPGLANAQPRLGTKQSGLGGDSTDEASLLLGISRSAPSMGPSLLDDLNSQQSAYRTHPYPSNVPNFPLDSRLINDGGDTPVAPGPQGALHPPPDQSPSKAQDGLSARTGIKATKPTQTSETYAETSHQNRVNKTQLPANPMQELSRQLATDVTSYLKLDQKTIDQSSMDALKTMIEGRLGSIVGQSAKTHKRSSTEAGLDGLSEALRPPKRVYCKTCDKTMGRLCDMKKHEKRHARPWGCTDAECNKSFGSKNDWKRHENSQHYQLEMWRCHEEDPESKIKICAKIFFRRDPFQQHLKRDHRKDDPEYLKAQVRQRRIGRAFQNTFWCGFCKEIIKLNALGLEAWDERFNHIDDLHFKKGQNIAEWYPMDKDLPKGKLRLQREHANGRGGLDDHDSDYSTDEEGSSRNEKGNRRRSHMSPPAPPPGPPSSGNTLGPGGSRARGQLFGVKSSNSMTSKEEVNKWYCSTCSYGPMNSTVDTSCCNCQKPR